MIPALQDLTLNPGSTFGPFLFRFKTFDTGDPIDLTDWLVWSQALYTLSCANAGCQKRLDLLPEITDAINGEVTLYMTDEATKPIPLGSGTWDILLQNPAGEILGPYIAGGFFVVKLVTIPTS